MQNDEYAINGSASYTSDVTYVPDGTTVNIRHTSSTSINTSVGGILPNNSHSPLGALTQTFSSTTSESDNSNESSSGGGAIGLNMFLMIFLLMLLSKNKALILKKN